MMLFSPQHKMSQVIKENYNLLPVINRFGIHLGFKDQTVEEVCHHHHVIPEFFLALVNTFHNEDYFPEKALQAFSPLLIVDYLKKTHVYYLEYVLPKIEGLLKALLQSCQSGCEDLQVIESFYRKYKSELLLHIQDEEEQAFPYVVRLVNQQYPVNPHYNIQTFEREHTNVDMKLNDLKNLLIKYLEPHYDANSCNEFLTELFRFEKDIKNHARIEDHILVPQVQAIENNQTIQ